ncbi:MAG: pyridoxamine 5'-phosphate oxidase, partial [Gammaproteobacteria bacterium]|nr:pyridoxamine 5'-phosphate oxidase [Gammaproteobacteria bacterium]
ASAQSQPLEERSQLMRAMQAIELRFPPGETVPRPPHWGGYRIWLTAVELWARGKSRLHDRGRWERDLGDLLNGCSYVPTPWEQRRLQP